MVFEIKHVTTVFYFYQNRTSNRDLVVLVLPRCLVSSKANILCYSWFYFDLC